MLPPSTTSEKSKDWQLELLMEKLRSKASQYKSFAETSKNVRMSMLDKRYSLDSIEKSQHQKCLDTLQQSIKVTSLQRMIEKLECLTRQLGLKFMLDSSGVELFISSDMFYLEIVLDQTGAVKDVKVHHGTSKAEQSCSELISCLSRGDFADFTAQLEGFASIYQLNAEKNVKCKAYIALQSLEADLTTLAQLQNFMKDTFSLVHKSPVGILEKRRGGHAMKLTYFVSPYDLINTESYDIDAMTVEAITSKGLGYSLTVCMEGSAAHKLQTTTLITVNRNMNGKSSPTFANLNSQNSAAIPACFVLKLNKPMPMCTTLVRQIQQITELDCAEMFSAPVPLLGLITSNASNGKFDGDFRKGMFVTLPDQQHCYFLTENKDMEGILINNIPFTHPCHVSQILMILRQQALFNTVITSCVRQNSRQDLENMIIFEVSALSSTQISISLEHPIEETMATAEIDLSEISKLECRIQAPISSSPPATSNDPVTELACAVLNRSFSIPITMRSVIKLWDKQTTRKSHYNGHENFSLALGSGDPGGHKGSSSDGLSEFGGLDGKIKQEPPGSGGFEHSINLPMMSHAHDGHLFLEEHPVLSNMELTNILQGSSVTINQQTADKSSRRGFKRKGNEDIWKSSKMRLGDELLETSSSDSASRSTPLSQETVSEVPTPNSGLGFQSDLELSALDPSELLGTSDKAAEFDSLDDLGEVEEMLTGHTSKLNRKTSSLLSDLSDKIITPTVSITPISTTGGAGYVQAISSRSGIEIIPINNPGTALPSSITITPISSKGDERREKKSGKIKDDRARLEKKRKKRKEESTMGPPDKLPIKQDPLNKPVTVSIKPADISSPTSPSMMRKFSPSPTHSRNLTGKLSPNPMKSPAGMPSSSPKHSPAQTPGASPKNGAAGAIASPKGASPKHPSGGSGKPSMSTLKSAANSPSGKGGGGGSGGSGGSSGEGKVKSLSSSSGLKEKKLGFNSGLKIKSSIKVKGLEIVGGDGMEVALEGGLGGMEVNKTSPTQVRNRKGSLSAVIDKLKSAQHSEGIADLLLKTRERPQPSNKSTETTASTIKSTTINKNSEYMVKPSSDGMKITINKTRTKDASSSSSAKPQNPKSSASGSGSPKTHTGLKPGVNSGPASKKPQLPGQKMGGASIVGISGRSSSPNYLTYKSGKLSPKSGVMAGKSGGKLGGSPKTGSLSVKEKVKVNKSGEKSIFGGKDGRKGSPTLQAEGDCKKMEPFVDGFVKQLDKSYQIPKLSSRASGDDKKAGNKLNSATQDVNNVTRETKLFDMIKTELNATSKFPLAIPVSKSFESIDLKMRNNINNILPVNPIPLKLPTTTTPTTTTTQQQQQPIKDDFRQPKDPKEDFKPFTTADSLALSAKSVDLSTKFATPTHKEDGKKEQKKDGEAATLGLLDYSNKEKTSFPASPSVSVHIVKSPSPLVGVSPHSASPGITDDELMDEALVGIGK